MCAAAVVCVSLLEVRAWSRALRRLIASNRSNTFHTRHTQDSVTGHKAGRGGCGVVIPECVCVSWWWGGPHHWAWLGPQDLT
jgi:hypothetical protein